MYKLKLAILLEIEMDLELYGKDYGGFIKPLIKLSSRKSECPDTYPFTYEAMISKELRPKMLKGLSNKLRNIVTTKEDNIMIRRIEALNPKNRIMKELKKEVKRLFVNGSHTGKTSITETWVKREMDLGFLISSAITAKDILSILRNSKRPI